MANTLLGMAGGIQYLKLKGATKKPRQSSEKTLRGILEYAKDTEYGREHHFADILKELRIATSPFDRFMYQVPGFRSRTIWKMVIAGYMYLSIVFEIFFSFFYRGSGSKDMLLSSILCIVEIIFIFDVFHLGRMSKRYTEAGRRHPAIRILTKTVIAVLIFTLYVMIYPLIREK